jgi:hypothetical protein
MALRKDDIVTSKATSAKHGTKASVAALPTGLLEDHCGEVSALGLHHSASHGADLSTSLEKCHKTSCLCSSKFDNV